MKNSAVDLFAWHNQKRKEEEAAGGFVLKILRLLSGESQPFKILFFVRKER
ncbi:MAG: hypothetical protein WC238_01290 [Parcubacteria group bacterium]|jgi:hypothetical protein